MCFTYDMVHRNIYKAKFKGTLLGALQCLGQGLIGVYESSVVRNKKSTLLAVLNQQYDH